MGIVINLRHERFAQALARGKSANGTVAPRPHAPITAHVAWIMPIDVYLAHAHDLLPVVGARHPFS
jgi:hypothetical protein